jgi:hypothetical protein
LDVSGVEDTGKAEVHVRAMAEVKAISATGAGDAIEVADAVKSGDIARAWKVVMGGAAGTRKSNIVKAYGATILPTIHPMNLL